MGTPQADAYKIVKVGRGPRDSLLKPYQVPTNETRHISIVSDHKTKGELLHVYDVGTNELPTFCLKAPLRPDQ